MGFAPWIEPLALAALVGLTLSGIATISIRLARGIVWSSARTGVFRRIAWPMLLLGPTLAVRVALPVVEDLAPSGRELLTHLSALILIGLVGWLLIAFVSLLDTYVDEAFPVGVEDNLEARRIHTRFRVLRRLFVMLTVILCSIAALMTFPGMRALGTGLLASAGIVGIVVGIAARPTVETLIAGIQLAWTQPIRLDDVVIMEGEWGRIEEIGATYVVVRLWDLRRLVVPISYLLSHPFQNWTRTSADLLGAVTVEVDYLTPVDAVREAVGEILRESALFDGGFWNLQAVDAGPQTMKLRVLCKVPNADVGWELRCEVREKLIAYLQRTHPGCLPRLRAELVPRSGGEADGATGESGSHPGRSFEPSSDAG